MSQNNSSSENPNFSQIVCSSSLVRSAFSSHRTTRIWWNLILLLHGKKVDKSLSSEQRTRRIAQGFRFYAWLYRILSFVFFFLMVVLSCLNFGEDRTQLLYWIGTSGLTAAYLWSVSGLGFKGAKSYGEGQSDGRVSLLVFMVMLVAFLSLFFGSVSAAVQQFQPSSAIVNLTATSLLFVFGVGSYFIEILYLANENPS